MELHQDGDNHEAHIGRQEYSRVPSWAGEAVEHEEGDRHSNRAEEENCGGDVELAQSRSEAAVLRCVDREGAAQPNEVREHEGAEDARDSHLGLAVSSQRTVRHEVAEAVAPGEHCDAQKRWRAGR